MPGSALKEIVQFFDKGCGAPRICQSSPSCKLMFRSQAVTVSVIACKDTMSSQLRRTKEGSGALSRSVSSKSALFGVALARTSCFWTSSMVFSRWSCRTRSWRLSCLLVSISMVFCWTFASVLICLLAFWSEKRVMKVSTVVVVWLVSSFLRSLSILAIGIGETGGRSSSSSSSDWFRG